MLNDDSFGYDFDDEGLQYHGDENLYIEMWKVICTLKCTIYK